MTWMIIRLILSLAFIGGVLWFAARLAKKRGLGQGNGVIEIVARHRLGRASTLNVVRIADVVLVVGATEEQVTLLAEVEDDELAAALAATPSRAPAADGETPAARPALPGSGVLAGSVLDRGTWTTVVQELRDRTVRRP